MHRNDVTELHCIIPFANLPSVMQRGILSNHRAERVTHESVAMDEMQERRRAVRVPNGRRLHEYANLYFTARNPMMYKRKHMHAELAVLSIRHEALDIPDTVVTDRNAATSYVRFEPAPDGVSIVNKEQTFAVFWTHDDPYEKMRRKSAKQAEVLVPDAVSPEYIRGAYVSTPAAQKELRKLCPDLKTAVRPNTFFLPG